MINQPFRPGCRFPTTSKLALPGTTHTGAGESISTQESISRPIAAAVMPDTESLHSTRPLGPSYRLCCSWVKAAYSCRWADVENTGFPAEWLLHTAVHACVCVCICEGVCIYVPVWMARWRMGRLSFCLSLPFSQYNPFICWPSPLPLRWVVPSYQQPRRLLWSRGRPSEMHGSHKELSKIQIEKWVSTRLRTTPAGMHEK